MYVILFISTGKDLIWYNHTRQCTISCAAKEKQKRCIKVSKSNETVPFSQKYYKDEK